MYGCWTYELYKKMFTEIGKAKRGFAEMCKSWSAFNRSKVCYICVYVHTRKTSYQQRVSEENLCGCCEELLMILKTKKIY
jgi:transcription initiation factor IIE alpha subunit